MLCPWATSRGFGDLFDDVQGLGHLDWATPDSIGERVAAHQFHHEVVHIVRVLESVDDGDVGMIE